MPSLRLSTVADNHTASVSTTVNPLILAALNFGGQNYESILMPLILASLLAFYYICTE